MRPLRTPLQSSPVRGNSKAPSTGLSRGDEIAAEAEADLAAGGADLELAAALGFGQR